MSFGPSASGAGGLCKASLWCRETNKRLLVHYNPTQVKLDKAVFTVVHPTKAAAKGSPADYVNTFTRTLHFTLTLDKWSTDQDVVEAVNTIHTWLNPSEQSLQKNAPDRPTIEFLWWNDDPDWFVGMIQSANASYTVFDTNGRPVRATVDIAMLEVPPIPPPTNPTSGSPGGGETTLVREHDTLEGIAYRRYGDAALWRGLAAANNVTDPMALKPGQRLLLPALSAVKGLS